MTLWRFSLKCRLLAVFALAIGIHAAPAGEQLVVCGRAEVSIVDLSRRDTDGTPRKIWSWAAAGRADLPAEYQSLFRTTDDCKSFDGGRRILITSSGGGVALVDRIEDRVVFYGRATNAHSADLLPRGRIAVAASRSSNGSGDAIVLFDSAHSGRELWRDDLVSGHGIVWDEQRRIVWALADQEVRGYQLVDWDTAAPKLARLVSISLPENGGHDLFPVPHSADLAVTTSTRCWLLDRDRRELRPHPDLGSHARVKCISPHPRTGRIAYVQALPDHWWSHHITLLEPHDSFPPPDEQVYKVRWVDEGAGVQAR